jgi:hypothetical protein
MLDDLTISRCRLIIAVQNGELIDPPELRLLVMQLFAETWGHPVDYLLAQPDLHNVLIHGPLYVDLDVREHDRIIVRYEKLMQPFLEFGWSSRPKQ